MDKSIIIKIQEALSSLPLHEVILFGSHAKGTSHQDSDIDLYVVTDDDSTPKNFAEKNEKYLTVARKLYKLEKLWPIDLIVHTKAMNKKFREINQSFSEEIYTTGMRII